MYDPSASLRLRAPCANLAAVNRFLDHPRAAARRVSGPVWALSAVIAGYIAVFGALTWRHHANFATFGFDMGIYDQGIWLVSRFREPFVTVRGLNLFANHVDPIYLLFVPAYWLGAGPIFLSLVQAVWVAIGAVPVWLLARDRLENAWLAVGLAGAFLLYPALQWATWWHFHPETLATTPLLFAYWLATRQRWRWFIVAVGLALLCKESVAMAAFVLGILVAWRWNRKVGVATAGAAIAWFFVATRLIIPAANDGTGPFYSEFYGQFGDSALGVAIGMVRHPGEVLDVVSESSRLDYYRMMLAPLAFLPLGELAVLAIALPQVIVNVIGSHSLTHSIRYQYTAVVTAGAMLATIESVRRFGRTMGLRRFLVGAVVATSLAANVAWSPSPIGVKYNTGIWARDASPRHATVNEALDLLPPDAGVSATYYLVPQLTHRVRIYEWPNPFKVAYWGVEGENQHPATNAEYLAIDRTLLGENRELFDELIASDYGVIFDRDGIVVARRR